MLLATTLLGGATACALQIDTVYIAPGQLIPSVGVAGERPGNASGDGDLVSVVRAAADAWEALIADDHRITLTFGWYPTGSFSNSAFHVHRASGGTPNREVAGSLAFNNGEDGFQMFLDPTPHTGEEFALIDRAFSDYGAGPIEDTRRFAATTAEAAGRNDLYTAALHEIGHALGLTSLNAFEVEVQDGDIDVTLPGFLGTTIPVEGTHVTAPESLLANRPRSVGERRGVTQLDLLSVCQVSRFTGCAVDLGPADYAGDLNGDGVTDAADYTVARDALSAAFKRTESADGLTDSVREVWSDGFGLTFTTEASLAGDFNADGRIDAADYTLWRDGLQSTDNRADGDANGRLNDADYDVWASAYGGSTALPTGRPLQTPEPNTGLLLAAAAASAAWRRAPG